MIILNEPEYVVNFHNDINSIFYVAAISDILNDMGYRNQAQKGKNLIENQSHPEFKI